MGITTLRPPVHAEPHKPQGVFGGFGPDGAMPGMLAKDLPPPEDNVVVADHAEVVVKGAPPDIDFSKIDTPEKAALLPVLNPAALVTVAFGVMRGMLHNNLYAPIPLQLSMGTSTFGNVTYQPASSPDSLSAQGQLGGAAFQETWTRDDNAHVIRVCGQIGASKEDLTIAQMDKGGAVSGKIGDIDVAQALTFGTKEDEPLVMADGALGTVRFHQEVVRLDSSDIRQTVVGVKGMLGDKPIQTEVRATATRKSLDVHAEGTIAGTTFKMDSVLPD